MKLRKNFHFYKQSDAMDCGPACLKMISKHYGKDISMYQLRKLCSINRQGVSFAGLGEAAEELGFKVLLAETKLEALQQKIPLPCILHWGKKHFVVLYDINDHKARIADPAISIIQYSIGDLLKHWQISPKEKAGRAILLEPKEKFFAIPSQGQPKAHIISLWNYLKPHKKRLFFILITLVSASLFTLILPFLTQQIIDKGIRENNLSYIQLIVFAQCGLIIGRIFMDVIRARLLFHLGTKISIKALTDFLAKLMRLPLPFFDTRNIGDNMQRMLDHQRIEQFLTGSLINILLSAISILVFGSVLWYYSLPIFFIFIMGSLLILLWTFYLAEKRKILDHHTFKQSSANQSLLIETLTAMQEIKLTECNSQKLTQFQTFQENNYSLKLASLKLDQRLLTGTQIVNELKNVLIAYVAASQVISGEITLGIMLSVSYISGQLNTPLLQFSEFIRTAQNAGFSLRRMNEVQTEKNEDADISEKPNFDPADQSIILDRVSFRYGTSQSPYVLKSISLTIPPGKVTAIVGMSGSGKTTLIKLLLKFYAASEGNLYLGNEKFSELNALQWRKKCGVVMQDGFIFSDSIAGNISIGHDIIDMDQLYYAAKMASIDTFINELPFGYDTIIGKDGHGLSEGQIQRILIARLIYRKPQFIFLDEATNSLDANNEKVIIDNLQEFFKGKTVVVVAHRLSTVKNADQIVVLDKGQILEAGEHQQLTNNRGAYYNLIKNQLELGK